MSNTIKVIMLFVGIILFVSVAVFAYNSQQSSQNTQSQLSTSRSLASQNDNTSNSQTSETASQPLRITQAELSQHNDTQSCYMSYKGIVYDLTNYINTHPGGKDILKGCGRDISYLESAHAGPKPSSNEFQALLQGKNIGELQ